MDAKRSPTFLVMVYFYYFVYTFVEDLFPDPDIYAYMARVAKNNNFSIAPFNDTATQNFDVVGFRDYVALNSFYSANYFEVSIGMCL
jgi:hypothetical protein